MYTVPYITTTIAVKKREEFTPLFHSKYLATLTPKSRFSVEFHYAGGKL